VAVLVAGGTGDGVVFGEPSVVEEDFT